MRLDEIEPEVIHIILEYVSWGRSLCLHSLTLLIGQVYNTSPKTIWNDVKLVNRYFHEAVKVVLHRRKIFWLSDSVQISLGKAKWVRDAEVLQNLRHLTVEPRKPYYRYMQGQLLDVEDPDLYQEFLNQLEPFNEVLRSIKNLKSLTWNAGPIPHTLLETLHYNHPRAILKVYNFSRFTPGLIQLDRSEIALSTFPNLTDFHFRPRAAPSSLQFDWYTSDSYLSTVFHSFIAASKSLRYAGIVYPSFIHRLHNLSSNEQDELDSDIKSSSRCHSLRSITLDGPNLKLTKDFLDNLNRHIDISKLESLKFSRGFTGMDYFQNAAAMLPGIKHVSLNLGVLDVHNGSGDELKVIVQAAKDYLLSCSPLQTLSLWSWELVVTVNDLVARHGQTLENLQLHEKEFPVTWTLNDYSRDYRKALSIADLRSIRNSCPKLMMLTFDINLENGSFDLFSQPDTLEILDEIAKFRPSLPKVQIYFDTSYLRKHLAKDDEGSGNEDSEDNDEDVEEEGGEEGSYTSPIPINDESNSEEQQSNSAALHGAANHDTNQETNQNTTNETITTTPSTNATAFSNTDQPTFAGSPPRKRLRLRTINSVLKSKPDPEEVVQAYVESIWKRLHGSSSTGERLLDVKFGEWESKALGDPERFPRRFYEVCPHERDDRVGECVIKMKKK